ncbi:MAG: enoyl-CoA hydratase [Pseudonocardia sp.]|jgi:enoyl-CoA hydratase
MAELAPLTVGCSKQVLNAVPEPEVDPGAEKELLAAFEACWTSEDFAEGRRARTEKRPPRFTRR